MLSMSHFSTFSSKYLTNIYLRTYVWLYDNWRTIVVCNYLKCTYFANFFFCHCLLFFTRFQFTGISPKCFNVGHFIFIKIITVFFKPLTYQDRYNSAVYVDLLKNLQYINIIEKRYKNCNSKFSNSVKKFFKNFFKNKCYVTI